MIHPGYGFLSENPTFARKVIDAGMIWVGPPGDVIELVGDKISARHLANKCNVPIVPGTPDPIKTYGEAKRFVEQYGFPIIIKAAFGGGGRGIRIVTKFEDLEDLFNRAVSEAKASFGDSTVFIERFVDKTKHIEVQFIADSYGNVVHLFERDCSVQRRHQKVVEIAPAKDLSDNIRTSILNDAVKIAKEAKYINAGTVEFLVDNQGRHYFIEINPRIQIEHTITEEITGIDIVAAQVQIAAGASLKQLGLTQDRIGYRGFSIQCRITTEDPSKNFQPDTGKIEVYRSAGGNGVRLDGGNGFAGSIISPHYDSLLVKCTCSGSTFEMVRRKMIRALIEFRIRGVKTNIPFLITLLNHETFIFNKCWTTFIDDTPRLFDMLTSQNRASKILSYIADLTVNGSSIKGQVGTPKLTSDPIIPTLKDSEDNVIDVSKPSTKGWRKILIEKGPEEFAKMVHNYKGTLIMDTTWRDAHQSLLATRVRTYDLCQIAPTTSYALSNAFALECWGGATFDVSMRFLHEDPWSRLRKLRKLVPNIPFQMLLRGANGVAYSTLPDNAIDHFVKQAKENGIDIFRIFDALNDLNQLKVGIDAVKKVNGVVEATICYSGDMLNPKKKKYNLKYYLTMVDKIVKIGTHFLGIKDMAGTLKPSAAKILIGAIRERYPSLPIHIHTHDSAGTGVPSMIAASETGADIIDLASNSMSGLTSQPSISAFLACVEGVTETGLNVDHVKELDVYWSQMRLLYSCFEADLKGPDAEVYEHEIPGGQLTNLIFQAQQVGLGNKWIETKVAYKEANQLLGDIVKVTPTSKVVGDLAQFMVSNNLTIEDIRRRAPDLDFPDSVLDFFEGLIGQPYGGFPEPLRTDVLRGKRRKLNTRPGKSLKQFDLVSIKSDLQSRFNRITECDVASYNMYPTVYENYRKFLEKYSDLSIIPTRYFLSSPKLNEEISIEIEQGKTLYIKLVAIGDLSTQTGTKEVFFELNGEMRKVTVIDKHAAVETISRSKADAHNPNEIGAPMAGVVVELRVHDGTDVKKGDPIAVLSAMKMEMVISAPVSGKISNIEVKEGDSVDASDLICKIVK